MIQRKEPHESDVQPRLVHMTTVPMTLHFLEDQIEFAKQMGVDVHVLSAPDPALAEFGTKMNVQAHEVPMERRITPLRDLVALHSLSKILRKIRPHIVHGHTPKGGLLSMLGSWWCGVPLRVYHIHGLPMVTATGLKRWLLRSAEKISCMAASQVYCVSNSVRDLAVAEGLCPAKKIKVLLNGTINGIDAASRFNPDRLDASVRSDVRRACNIPNDALVIGFIGRIVRDKGIVELASAWSILRKEFPNLHLLMIGPFEPQDPVPADVEQQLRNDDRIHLVGMKAAEEIPDYCVAMDILALPSYREGFNTVLLEASAMRLPVVSSRVPGCIDGIVEGETGVLVPCHDAVALADALRNYLSNPELRQRHGNAGRIRVLRDFRPGDLSQAIYQEYVRLLERKGIYVMQKQQRDPVSNAKTGITEQYDLDHTIEDHSIERANR
jgi:glycosyltransferase involved in cell wall biosynthesis